MHGHANVALTCHLLYSSRSSLFILVISGKATIEEKKFKTEKKVEIIQRIEVLSYLRERKDDNWI